MDPYEDIEDPQSNERRLTLIEASINRALLYDATGVQPSCKNNNNSNCVIYISGSIIVIVIIFLVIFLTPLNI